MLTYSYRRCCPCSKQFHGSYFVRSSRSRLFLLSYFLSTKNEFLWSLTWSLGRGRRRRKPELASFSSTFVAWHFQPSVKTRIYLKMHSLAISEAVKRSFVTLLLVNNTSSVTVSSSLSSHSWFQTYEVSVLSFVLDFVCYGPSDKSVIIHNDRSLPSEDW